MISHQSVLVFLLGFLSMVLATCDRNLIPDLSFRLRGANLAFPCDSTKNIYTSTGRFIPKNVIATRMQIYKDSAIVALPRLKPGVPFTLGKFSLKSKDPRATLVPFPCWAIQEEGNCKALQSVIDLVIDPLEIVWVLDSGVVNTLEQPLKRCDPKIVGISAKTGQVLKVIDLSAFATPISRLQNLIVDYSPEGRAFAYVGDAGLGAIVVYDVFADKGYRVVLPKAVAAGGVKDVLYMALVKKPCGNVVFFTYLSAPHMFYIKAIYLQQGQAAGAVVDVGPKPNGEKIVLLGTDNRAALFFRYKSESDIYLWNSETCFKPDNFLVVQKGGDCRLSTQVVPGYKKLMWALESNFHDYVAGTAGCTGASMAVHPLVKTV